MHMMEAALSLSGFFCSLVVIIVIVIVIVCESLVLWSWRWGGADGIVPAGVGAGRAPGQSRTRIDREKCHHCFPP